MSQPAAPQQSRKKALLSLLVLLALTGVLVFIFKDHWAEITGALGRLSAWQVLVVLALGITYPLLEGCVSYVIVKGRLPGFTLRQGIDNAWSGTFGNVVTLGAGAVPFQTWYLHRCGLPAGPGVGLMTLQYVFHKTTVLLYATVLLVFQHKWLAANTTGVLKYLPAAYAVVAAVILGLAAGLSAQNRKMAAAPGRLAAAAGRAGRREPPAAGRQTPLRADLCPARAQAVSSVLHPVAVHPVHAAFAAGVCPGAAAHQPDAVHLQCTAQCGGHGVHRNGLSAAVQRLSAPGRNHERADAVPHCQLLCGGGHKRRGLFLCAAAPGPDAAQEGVILVYFGGSAEALYQALVKIVECTL